MHSLISKVLKQLREVLLGLLAPRSTQATSETPPNLSSSYVNKMTALTPEALQLWKNANPENAKLQALSLAALEEKSKQVAVDWKALDLGGKDQPQQGPWAKQRSLA